jgi:hypothetical protein
LCSFAWELVIFSSSKGIREVFPPRGIKEGLHSGIKGGFSPLGFSEESHLGIIVGFFPPGIRETIHPGIQGVLPSSNQERNSSLYIQRVFSSCNHPPSGIRKG